MKKLLSIILISVSSISFAACDKLYPGGKPIHVPDTTELCNTFYVSLFNEKQKAVILTSELIAKDSYMTRINHFKPDLRLVNGPVNSDYKNSKYDRGHMVPAGDSSTKEEMSDTFLLTNMTPQEPSLNRVSWNHMEQHIRKKVDSSKSSANILTIAIYNKPSRIGPGIPVPAAYWKIVYLKDSTLYYFAENKPNALVKPYSNVDVNKIINTQKF